eukprot:SAG31_NODE_20851_length_564_cov_0.873118_2_plen_25_part_01
MSKFKISSFWYRVVLQVVQGVCRIG